ncbi:glutaredoxin-3 [bacterium BMS3Abin05]|nr:glutaredoxin-3 [bacterium BMS3Abin05]GBE28673.1 glutaredoxin-3 [bacterium BMS3Bbin03]HDK35912.1 NrdH-redoxin [Bacteroidota bacterium]HDL78763.1 NrdH-redoxin [Bacteroidota bacterium]
MALPQNQPKVIVFTTPTCPHCRAVKQYLKQNNIRFKDIDVSKDLKAAADMVRKTGQSGVPVIFINNRPIIGFNRAQINQMLGLHG